MCERSRRTRESAVTRPRWGTLYATVLPQVAALGLVEAVQSPAAVRLTLRCALAVALFATMSVWLRANRSAFDLQNWCDCAGRQVTVRVLESCVPAFRTGPLETPVTAAEFVDDEYEVAGR